MQEISFCPEIGDATVGSSASTTMKDSSVRGSGDPGETEQPGVTFPPYPPSSVFKGMGEGHLAPLVRGLRYVNASGALVDLDARRSPAEASRVRALGGSYGLLGPVVDVLLETRPLALVDVRIKVVPQGAKQSDAAYAEELLALRNECDNREREERERREREERERERERERREEEKRPLFYSRNDTHKATNKKNSKKNKNNSKKKKKRP